MEFSASVSDKAEFLYLVHIVYGYTEEQEEHSAVNEYFKKLCSDEKNIDKAHDYGNDQTYHEQWPPLAQITLIAVSVEGETAEKSGCGKEKDYYRRKLVYCKYH